MNSRRWIWTLIIAVDATLLCALFAPAVVNGDGLGYLKAAPTGIVVSGHLAYLPLLRALGQWLGRSDSLALLEPARWLSYISCGLAAGLLHSTAARLLGLRAGIVAGLGCALSFGALQAGADVEAYAPALAALALVLWSGAHRRDGGNVGWLLLTALGVAAAALLHVENVLVAPAAALLCAWRSDERRLRVGDLLTVPLVSGTLVAACYLAVFLGRGDTPAAAIRWLTGASHGFSYPLSVWTPAVALYGLAKTLVHSPYPIQAGWTRVLLQTLIGLAALAAMVWIARRPGRPRTVGRLVGLAWTLPYAVVGVAFFGSDNERWVFLLPVAWLAVAAGVEASTASRRVAAALLVGLLGGDLAFGLPVARDRTIREQADSVTALFRPYDLIISPGHSWDEYIGFYDARPLDRYPMVYFAGLLGGAEPMRAELDIRVGQARARRARIYFLRGDEAVTSDGWKELVRFGVTPASVDRFLPAGPRTPIARGLVRIDPPR